MTKENKLELSKKKESKLKFLSISKKESQESQKELKTSFLLSLETEKTNFSFEEKLATKINDVFKKQEIKMEQFFYFCNIPSLKNDFLANGIISFSQLSELDETTFNQMYITAAKQDKIQDAIKKVVNQDTDNNKEMFIQTEPLSENDKLNFSFEKPPVDFKPKLKPNSKIIRTEKNKDYIFDNSVFDFTFLLGNKKLIFEQKKQVIVETKKVNVCKNCFCAFIDFRIDGFLKVGVEFCSEICDLKKPKKVDIGMQIINEPDSDDTLIEESLDEEIEIEQEVRKRVPENIEIDLDFSFEN